MKKRKNTIQEIPTESVRPAKPQQIKSGRVVNSKCRYYISGTCSYANIDCNVNSFKCRNNIKPSYQLVAPRKPDSQGTGLSYGVKQKRDYPEILPDMKIVDLSKDMPQLIIYDGSLCEEQRFLEDRGVIVASMDRKRTYTIYTTYNKKQKEYYISNDNLYMYYQRNMLFYAYMALATDEDCTNPMFTYDEVEQVSLLKMYGYRAGKTGLSAEDRHMIIRFLVDTNRCDVNGIINNLDFNIRIREKNKKKYAEAITQWSDDIIYTYSQYLSHQ